MNDIHSASILKDVFILSILDGLHIIHLATKEANLTSNQILHKCGLIQLFFVVTTETLINGFQMLEMVQDTMHHKQKQTQRDVARPSGLDTDDQQDAYDKHEQQCNKTNQATFFQLTGHKECFKLGTRPNTIMKKSTGNEEKCFNQLISDELSSFVPRLLRKVIQDGNQYLEMQDLLAGFRNAAVMDVKMGCRTYREEELDSALREAKLRHDMYEKMIEIDQNEPTADEKKLKAITKPRYMIWRESVSSTASLGFRIEGMRLKDGSVDKEFKTIKDEEQVAKAFMRYAASMKIRMKYLKRLHDLKQALMKSRFFLTHELIGSSLLFVHSDEDANIWLIDFAKTHSLPTGVNVTHSATWNLGNHEDGYLIGIDNLIRIFESIISRASDRISAGQQFIQQKAPEDIAKHNSSTRGRVKLNGSDAGLKEITRFLPKLKT